MVSPQTVWMGSVGNATYTPPWLPVLRNPSRIVVTSDLPQVHGSAFVRVL